MRHKVYMTCLYLEDGPGEGRIVLEAEKLQRPVLDFLLHLILLLLAAWQLAAFALQALQTPEGPLPATAWFSIVTWPPV